MLSFAVISGGGWLLDVVIALSLVSAGVPPFVANLISAFTAVSFVFFVSRVLVFRQEQPAEARHFAQYLLWHCIAIPAASLLIAVLAHWGEPMAAWALEQARSQGIDAGRAPIVLSTGVAKVVVTPLSLISNFFFTRWLLGRSTAAPSPSSGSLL